MKITSADRWFSLLVREAANNTCFACGAASQDCAHIISRVRYATRWHPQNAIPLCKTCHTHFGFNPVRFAYVCAAFGTTLEVVDELDKLCYKNSFYRHKMIAYYYKQQYEYLMMLRKAGYKGKFKITPVPNWILTWKGKELKNARKG